MLRTCPRPCTLSSALPMHCISTTQSFFYKKYFWTQTSNTQESAERWRESMGSPCSILFGFLFTLQFSPCILYFLPFHRQICYLLMLRYQCPAGLSFSCYFIHHISTDTVQYCKEYIFYYFCCWNKDITNSKLLHVFLLLALLIERYILIFKNCKS